MATRNKLPYLMECLPRLLAAMRPDEEIVIVDGASSDGTTQYLQSMAEQGFIQQFLSEPDAGEAHAMNKALLLARGELIKIITDDDVYYWPAIQQCKEFMLAHPEIDILGTEGYGVNWQESTPNMPFHYRTNYLNWKSNGIPFSFCGLGIMMRRSSIAILGLFHTGFMRVDLEYTIRVTSVAAKLAWFTGLAWVRISNPSSNMVRLAHLSAAEENRINQFYLPDTTRKTRPRNIGWVIKKIKNVIKRLLMFFVSSPADKIHADHIVNESDDINLALRFKQYEEWLETQNQRDHGTFLYRANA